MCQGVVESTQEGVNLEDRLWFEALSKKIRHMVT